MAHRPLTVLTVSDVLATGGGAERVVHLVAASLDRARFRPIVLSTRAHGSSAAVRDELAKADVETLVLDRSGPLDLAAWRPALALIRRTRPDVLHAHKFGSNVWGVLIGRATRIPVVVAHEHTWSYEGQPLRRFLDRELVARGADAFVAVSAEDRRRMIEVEGIDATKIRLIYNGVPAGTPTGRDVRAELGIPAGAPVVGTVGMLRPQKAHDVLIDAAAALRTEFPELRVLIVGDGSESARELVRSRIRELGLERTVLLLGLRSDVPDVLSALDVAVLTSDFEGTSLAILEYMAAGKAIVATAVGGTPELVEDGVSGVLVPRRDVAAFASAVAGLLRDPQRRAGLAEAARERRREQFDAEAMTRNVESLYEELFARTARARAEGWTPQG